ncbi:N6-adenosine-methyltransferase catalytic subunit [Strongylocentrotus purpuratus]|uniref:mRNA m(6)A methyltransferase n=1 Tax=Strongylocentrotus purpuratus TaxID=7668 RepID=A0A7M7N4S3_STRPU|nr:N6-adenosine-methyltransferase catalytic subunit [Strongylocentrotus purpuratus]XP_030831244.1 N6-adenosine-methyltransferase catalytic subunit [Strongylocentrotus purpuratus]
MSSTLEALKKKREDLKAKLMRRKEITGIGVGESKSLSLKLEVSSSPIPPVSVPSQSVSSTSTGIKLEDGSPPLPIPKNPVNAGSQSISDGTESRKRKREESDSEQDGPAAAVKQSAVKSEKEDEVVDLSLENLLSSTSFKEQESKEMGQEIHDLLSMPTAKEKSIKEAFKSKGGTVHEFCSHGTRDECKKVSGMPDCNKLHFKRIINKHTDESLGDCSFLNTCFHMDTCKYVHYEVEERSKSGEEDKTAGPVALQRMNSKSGASVMTPPQWVQCDLRSMDFEVLGKFSVIMADPPWDIHMELPYGTMQDDEMRKLNVPLMQDEGCIFLWVTGRAMELGRECLQLWGYKQVEELIWVKTNQLQRLIRTGRTGHWLNHGKEHCLCGVKGNPDNFNKGLDCDVIVAEVRQTSHKPDEIYGLIERLSPGTRKIELFGRMHNIQPNWVTLGNQLDGVHLVEPETIKRYQEKYPDNNALKAPQK